MVSDFIQRSYAPTTLPTYLRHWSDYKTFLQENNLGRSLPSTTPKVAMFIADLARRGKSAGVLRATLSSIAWFHNIRCLPDPTKALPISRILQGVKKNGAPPARKDAITKQILKDILAATDLMTDAFQRSAIKSLFLLAYHGCFRIGELCKSNNLAHTIRIENVSFVRHRGEQQTHLVITLNTFKHSQQPATIAIQPNPQTAHCPVEALKDYLRRRLPNTGPLFISQTGTPLSRAQVVKILKWALTKSGHQAKCFNTHSFRIGRATDLALSGCPDSLIRETGRWASNAFMQYLRFNIFTIPL